MNEQEQELDRQKRKEAKKIHNITAYNWALSNNYIPKDIDYNNAYSNIKYQGYIFRY